jgi:hypothetical protein
MNAAWKGAGRVGHYACLTGYPPPLSPKQPRDRDTSVISEAPGIDPTTGEEVIYRMGAARSKKGGNHPRGGS